VICHVHNNACFINGCDRDGITPPGVGGDQVLGSRARNDRGGGGEMIIATNDSLMYEWIKNASNPANNAGSFVRAIAEAALRADHENYALLRPVLLELRRKYPQYTQSLASLTEEFRRSSGSSGS